MSITEMGATEWAEYLDKLVKDMNKQEAKEVNKMTFEFTEGEWKLLLTDVVDQIEFLQDSLKEDIVPKNELGATQASLKMYGNIRNKLALRRVVK